MKAKPLTESHKALLVLAAVMVAGLLSALVYAVQSRAEQGFLAIASKSKRGQPLTFEKLQCF